MELENKEICKKCGGKCCQKSGCDYYPEDFESLKVDYILQVLSEGFVSIVSLQNFEMINGKLTNTPFLFLRTRGVNRGPIDLLSFKARCIALTETGCRYDFKSRPSGGKNLVPSADGKCYPKNDLELEMKKWEPYQRVLAKCVKRLTGKSVYQVIKEDVKKLFIDIYNRNFEGVAESELEDMKSAVPFLAEVYKEEYLEAKRETIVVRNMKLK